MKQYKVIRAYSTYRKGDILEANGMLGAAIYQDLMARGFIELVNRESLVNAQLVDGIAPVDAKPEKFERQRRKHANQNGGDTQCGNP